MKKGQTNLKWAQYWNKHFYKVEMADKHKQECLTPLSH